MSVDQISDVSEIKDHLFGILVDVGKGKYDRKFLDSLEGDLSKLGMNSLTFIKLLILIEKRFGLEIDFEIVPMESLNSLPKFSDYLFNHSPLIVKNGEKVH